MSKERKKGLKDERNKRMNEPLHNKKRKKRRLRAKTTQQQTKTQKMDENFFFNEKLVDSGGKLRRQARKVLKNGCRAKVLKIQDWLSQKIIFKATFPTSSPTNL